MERPSTRTLLAALSCFGAPLALLGALTPLTTGPAHADTVAPAAEGIGIPVIDPGPSVEEDGGREDGGMDDGVVEDDPMDEEDDAVASEAVRDDLLVLLASLPDPVADNGPSTTAPIQPAPIQAALVAAPDAPVELDQVVDEDVLLEMLLPSDAMGGY